MSKLSTVLVSSILASGCAADLATDTADQALTAAPTIAALGMRGAPPAGGATILVVGLDLDPAATVTYAGVDAASITACSTSCTSAPYVGLVTTTPALAEGYVDLVVTNPDGQSATFPNFHIGPAPLVDSFAPLATRKGKSLTITGNYFLTTPQVNIGGQIARVTSSSATQVVVTVPKLNVGAYPVFVTNPDTQFTRATDLLSITD